MKNAFKIAQWSPECNVIAMVLISRLTASTEATFNINNWDKVSRFLLLRDPFLLLRDPRFPE
jgi:hypothetical protein